VARIFEDSDSRRVPMDSRIRRFEKIVKIQGIRGFEGFEDSKVRMSHPYLEYHRIIEAQISTKLCGL
jgi:hypothetical protein